MPSSNYTGFELKVDAGDGLDHFITGATVKVYDITATNPVTGTGTVALADVVSDVNGHVASGTVAVAAGSKVRFSYTRAADGLCRCDSQVTT
jgi:hypothetical protein